MMQVTLPPLRRVDESSARTKLLYQELVGINSAKKRSSRQRSSHEPLPSTISHTRSNLVGNPRYTFYNYKSDTRRKEVRPRAAAHGGRDHSLPSQRTQKQLTVSRKATSATYDGNELPELTRIPNLNNLIKKNEKKDRVKEHSHNVKTSGPAGKPTEGKREDRFASSWAEFRAENNPRKEHNAAIGAKEKEETPHVVNKKNNEKKSNKDVKDVPKKDEGSKKETVRTEDIKSSIKDESHHKSPEHVKFNEPQNKKIDTDKAQEKVEKRQSQPEKIVNESSQQKVSSTVKEKLKREPISWRKKEPSGEKGGNETPNVPSNRPSMFNKPAGFSFSYTAGAKTAVSVKKDDSASKKSAGAFPKRPSMVRHREKQEHKLPRGWSQYSLKTKSDYRTAASEIRQPKTVYASETKKYLQARSRAGSRASLVSVGTNRGGGAKSTASSVYSRTTTKSNVPPWRKNGYTLTQREANAYRSVNSVYGAQTYKNKIQRQRQFYNKLEQVQLEEIRNYNSKVRQQQLKKQQSKVMQQRELKRMRDKFSGEQEKRFRNQYVTSKLLAHEKAPTLPYGLPEDFNSGARNTKLNGKSSEPREVFNRTSNLVRNYKKYSTLFQMHGGPNWDTYTDVPRMEGVDVVRMEEKDEKGNLVEKKLDVKKLVEAAQNMLDVPSANDADNLSVTSLRLDDDDEDDVFEKARRKYNLDIDDKL